MSEDLAEVVEGFLRARPSFLAENPALYRLLAPPARVHGEALADHMAAMLVAARAQAVAMAERADGVLKAGRAAAGLAQRVQAAVLALIASADPAECARHALPGLLGVDAATLCAEAELPGMHRVPPATVARLLDGRLVVCRTAPADAALLHAEAARLAGRDALVLVPWGGPPTLLALATREAEAVADGRGLGVLAFLGQALGVALDRAT
ncbi:MAG: hypothetical protein ACREFY_11510 [Acetobacteraceae bacterium]